MQRRKLYDDAVHSKIRDVSKEGGGRREGGGGGGHWDSPASA